MSEEKGCLRCGKTFRPRRSFQKFCTARCQSRNAEAMIDSGGIPGLSKTAIGAVNELRVCVDLMRRGYEVFRPVRGSAPCDLLAMRGKGVLRVEVKTGSVLKSGRLAVPKSDPDRYDVLAVVLSTTIQYLPELGV